MKTLCVSLALSSVAAWQPEGPADQCDVVPGNRTDCKLGGQQDCEASGCCWKPVDPNPDNDPWCFKKAGAGPSPPPAPAPSPAQCHISPDSRVDCGKGDQRSCEAGGCCWSPVDPNPHNDPWCFKKSSGPSPSPKPGPPAPPTPAPTPPPPPGPDHPLPGCDVYQLNHCSGQDVNTSDDFEAARWFTPLPGEPGYQPSFQSYGSLVAHAHVTYDGAARDKATLTIVAKHKDPTVKLTYTINGKESDSPTMAFAKDTQTGPVAIRVQGSDKTALDLDPVDFVWNAAPIKQRSGDYRGGQKGAIVEMFGWPHAEIEKECPHLAEAGYLGVKIFPMQEQVISWEPFNNMLNPWYFMYQPVSYRLHGRMGTRDELKKMVAACRAVGVRVYADAVLNHMSGGGNDANPKHRNPGAGCTKWGNKTSSLEGGHSPFYTQSFVYTEGLHTGKPPSQEFPAVPYGPTDFHCERALSSWTDPLDLNAGWLTGLVDLNTEKESVQERIADYLTDLIGVGVSGFRIDAAKHMRPPDLVGIFTKFRRNLGGALPGDFFTWLEVLLGGEADLLMCNSDSGYNYGTHFRDALVAAGFSAAEAAQVKTWNSGYPKETEKGVDDCSITAASSQRQAIQNDDADQQNPGSSSRDMQSEGCVLIKGCDEATHRNFEVKLFTSPNGASDNDNEFPIRLILSSFYWGEDSVQGIPDGKSDCSLCRVNCNGCKGMKYAPAYDANSKGYDKGPGQYTRVHRDAGIISAMRSWMKIGGGGLGGALVV